jgi:hypothetical protein
MGQELFTILAPKIEYHQYLMGNLQAKVEKKIILSTRSFPNTNSHQLQMILNQEDWHMRLVGCQSLVVKTLGMLGHRADTHSQNWSSQTSIDAMLRVVNANAFNQFQCYRKRPSKSHPLHYLLVLNMLSNFPLRTGKMSIASTHFYIDQLI